MLDYISLILFCLMLCVHTTASKATYMCKARLSHLMLLLLVLYLHTVLEASQINTIMQ